jgi:hypothetical protein
VTVKINSFLSLRVEPLTKRGHGSKSRRGYGSSRALCNEPTCERCVAPKKGDKHEQEALRVMVPVNRYRFIR